MSKETRLAKWNRDSLALAEQDYHEAVVRAEDLRLIRNDLIRLALAEGWTHAQIAEATGLTRGRIGQITTPKEER
jgi:hypothetical protein